MPKPYDASTKFLVERRPKDWLDLVGLEATEVEIVDADLSTVSAAADKLIAVRKPDPFIAHFDLQASYDAGLPDRSLQYQATVRNRKKLPVITVLVLLRPATDGPAITGQIVEQVGDKPAHLVFQYEVVRVWELPVQQLLAGGLGTLPLAFLSNVQEDELPDVVHQVQQRIRQEADPGLAGELWTAAYVLMGARDPGEMVDALLKGVRDMEESVTYQAIIQKGKDIGMREGEAKRARSILLNLGRKRFGRPDAPIRASIDSIQSPDRLERLAERILEASSWADLLRQSAPAPRPSRRRDPTAG